MIFSKVEQFFTRYAHVLNNDDISTKRLNDYYSFPCILVLDEPQKVFAENNEFASVVKNVLHNYRALGVTTFIPQITKVLSVSTNMTYVAIQWSFKNEADEQVLCLSNSYLLSEIDENYKIVVLIVDEQDEIFQSQLT